MKACGPSATGGPILFVASLLAACIQVEGATPADFLPSFRQHAASERSLDTCVSAHDINKMYTIVGNISGGFGGRFTYPFIDCFTGQRVTNPGWGFPKGSAISFGSASFWIGARRGQDTLVTTTFDADNLYGGFECGPDLAPYGKEEYHSIVNPNALEYEGAVSEQDIVYVYSDTFTEEPFGPPPDPFDGKPHRPLPVEITQRSYAWSYGYAEDFILFNLSIRNLGDETLNGVYFGVYCTAEYMYYQGDSPQTANTADEIGGFIKATSSAQGCNFNDTFNLAWSADNDGEPINGEFTDQYVSGIGKSVPHVLGICYLGTPLPEPDISYNWWADHPRNDTIDFGPRRRPTEYVPYRDFGTGGTGTPHGDGNKYYLLSNNEIDYATIYTGTVGPSDPDWMYPPQNIAADIADGQVHSYLLSVGPFTIPPGATMPIAFAAVCGENLHRVPGNLYYVQAGAPYRFYQNLDFSDLTKNALWAKWVYDNPGVDTDGDGYAGKTRICVLETEEIDGEEVVTRADTVYYEGDGVPDWRAAAPPPAPEFWLIPTLNGIHVRINGGISETTKDIFTQEIDFEGYRVYMARDERESSFYLFTSYDIPNYDKWVYKPNLEPYPDFEIQGTPFTLGELRCLYGLAPDPCQDLTFDPLAYTKSQRYILTGFPDSMFYFTEHDYNASQFGVTTEIRRTYPEATKPMPGEPLGEADLTDDGYLKYYEYECDIEGLLPTVPYWVNVTAFDFGSAPSGLQALETSKVLGAKSAYPASDLSQLSGEKAPVYVYPNPYRIDGHYRLNGYEGRGIDDRPDRRLRLLHFENLPARCTIEIYSLDGDLLRRIHHDVDPSDPNHTHDTWNLITRNGQAPVSGLYYWVVEDEHGNTEMGKFVLIF